MGGGSVNFPDPHEVGRAQFAWNNLNQVTPYGSVQYTPPELDNQGNPISSGTMTQTTDPRILALTDSMLGIRGSALDRINNMFGGDGVFGGGGLGGFTNPNAPPWQWPINRGPGTQWDNPPDGTNPDSNIKDPFNQLKSAGVRGASGEQVRGGGTGRATPVLDPRSKYDQSSAPNWQFGGSDVVSGPGGLGPMFYSNNAPALKHEYDMGALPGLLGAGDLTGERDRVAQAKFDRIKGLLDPVFEQKNTALAERMANRGMPVGAEEYNIRLDQLGDQENEAYLNAALDADLAGLQEMQGLAGMSAQQRAQLFGEQGAQIGMSNQARQQAFGEGLQSRDQMLRSMLGLGQLGIQQGQFGLQQQGQEFGQLASLLGLTQPPGAGGDLGQFYGPSPVDMMNAYGMNNQGAMFNSNRQISPAGLMSGLFGLGGAALGGGMFG